MAFPHLNLLVLANFQRGVEGGHVVRLLQLPGHAPAAVRTLNTNFIISHWSLPHPIGWNARTILPDAVFATFFAQTAERVRPMERIKLLESNGRYMRGGL